MNNILQGDVIEKLKEIKMEFTCIECETLYDDTDGDTDERMCNKCLDRIFDEDLERQAKKQVKSFMNKIDKFIKYFAQ
jgi:DNA-directed RNA polymerase subunit RPC12/RpoP